MNTKLSCLITETVLLTQIHRRQTKSSPANVNIVLKNIVVSPSQGDVECVDVLNILCK